MEELIERLKGLFARVFAGSTPELEQAVPLRKVGGFLIWDGFEGAEQIDRQRQVSRAVRENLTPEEQLQVTTILTLTPDEAMAMRAG